MGSLAYLDKQPRRGVETSVLSTSENIFSEDTVKRGLSSSPKPFSSKGKELGDDPWRRAAFSAEKLPICGSEMRAFVLPFSHSHSRAISAALSTC